MTSERRHLRSVPPSSSRPAPAPQGTLEPEHEALVRTCARRLLRELHLPPAELADLVQNGVLALLETLPRYDPSRGVKFEAFVYSRVRGAMIDGVASLQRHPRKIHAACKRAERMDSVTQEAAVERAENDRPLDPEALADRFDAKLSGLAASYMLSDAEEEEYPESPEDANIRRIDARKVRSVVETLSKEDQTLLRGLYVQERILDDIGEELGITKGQASRRHTTILERLYARLK
jgi:RNA polymerase sigma factor for flagellar operon FliA